jgi:ferredoxin-like protein FixX
MQPYTLTARVDLASGLEVLRVVLVCPSRVAEKNDDLPDHLHFGTEQAACVVAGNCRVEGMGDC